MASLAGWPNVLFRYSALLIGTHRHTHTAMERGLVPLVVVVVAVLALSPAEGAPSPTPDLDCDTADYTVLKEESTQIFSTMALKLESMAKSFVLMKPESDFKGVLLDVVEGDGSATHHTAWLPAEDCVSPNGTWQILERSVMKTEAGVGIDITLGTCRMECEFNITDTGLMSVRVEAHGPSRWRTIPPPKVCGRRIVMFVPPWEKREVSCQDPPPSITTTHTTTSPPPLPNDAQDQIPIIMLSGAVVVLVVLVVVLVVFCWKRKSVTSPNVVRFQSQPAALGCPLQSTTGKDHSTDQDEEHVYYEILPNLSTHRVVVPQPAHDAEQPVYDVLPPSSPLYENVPAAGGGASPHGHLKAPGVRESQLYAMVL